MTAAWDERFSRSPEPRASSTYYGKYKSTCKCFEELQVLVGTKVRAARMSALVSRTRRYGRTGAAARQKHCNVIVVTTT